MRVAIAGAGNVGRSIARELIANGHQVLLEVKERTGVVLDVLSGADEARAETIVVNDLVPTVGDDQPPSS